MCVCLYTRVQLTSHQSQKRVLDLLSWDYRQLWATTIWMLNENQTWVLCKITKKTLLLKHWAISPGPGDNYAKTSTDSMEPCGCRTLAICFVTCLFHYSLSIARIMRIFMEPWQTPAMAVECHGQSVTEVNLSVHPWEPSVRQVTWCEETMSSWAILVNVTHQSRHIKTPGLAQLWLPLPSHLTRGCSCCCWGF